jgi:hypothetical protein
MFVFLLAEAVFASFTVALSKLNPNSCRYIAIPVAKDGQLLRVSDTEQLSKQRVEATFINFIWLVKQFLSSSVHL